MNNNKEVKNSSMTDMLRSLSELIRIPSVKAEKSEAGPFGENIAKALDHTLSLCDNLGFRTKNCDDYCGYAEIGEGETLFGILAHLDVVPAGEGWDHPPFGAEIDDEKLYGRGAIDDKGPIIACIYAIKELMDEDVRFNCRIRFIFGLDEESGWEDMDHYLKQEELPSVGFTPDADFPVIYGEKGILTFWFEDPKPDEDLMGEYIIGGDAINMVPAFCRASVLMKTGELKEIEVRGVAAHGSTPEVGDNAISKIMHKLYEMKSRGDLSPDSKLDKIINFYHDKIGYDYLGKDAGYARADQESGDLTINVGMIEVKDKVCKIGIDMRYPVTHKYDEILEGIRENIRNTHMTIGSVDHLKPVFMDQNSDLIRTLLSVYREITGDPSEPLTMGGGTYARAMDNIVAFGPLFPGTVDTAHQKDEYISLSDLTKIKEIYKAAIRKINSDDE